MFEISRDGFVLLSPDGFLWRLITVIGFEIYLFPDWFDYASRGFVSRRVCLQYETSLLVGDRFNVSRRVCLPDWFVSRGFSGFCFDSAGLYMH